MSAFRKKCVKSKMSDVVYERDVFDTSTHCDETTTCVMCGGSRKVGEEMLHQLASYDDGCDYFTSDDELNESSHAVDRIWVSKHGMHGTKPIWVHYHCALFSPRTWLKRSQWHNVRSEVRRCRWLLCNVCNKRGANLGCRMKRCPFAAHVPCALRTGWNPVIINRGTFYCPIHAEEQRQLEELENAKYLCDLSRGREPLPISVSHDLLARYACLTQFTYITSNVDHDSTHSEAQDHRSLPRCSCISVCTVDCACAQSDSDDVIRECGMHCTCNLRRCSHRSVGRGIVHQLEVFEVSQGVLGVRVKENIAAGTFICEVTGQYRLGSFVSSASNDAKVVLSPEEDRLVYDLEHWTNASSVVYYNNGKDAGRKNEKCFLDSRYYGNVARFIRTHSNKNLKKKAVLIDQQNLMYPRLALLAAVDISKDSELFM